jgi:hypothetical protein
MMIQEKLISGRPFFILICLKIMKREEGRKWLGSIFVDIFVLNFLV